MGTLHTIQVVAHNMPLETPHQVLKGTDFWELVDHLTLCRTTSNAVEAHCYVGCIKSENFSRIGTYSTNTIDQQ